MRLESPGGSDGCAQLQVLLWRTDKWHRGMAQHPSPRILRTACKGRAETDSRHDRASDQRQPRAPCAGPAKGSRAAASATRIDSSNKHASMPRWHGLVAARASYGQRGRGLRRTDGVRRRRPGDEARGVDRRERVAGPGSVNRRCSRRRTRRVRSLTPRRTRNPRGYAVSPHGRARSLR